MSDQGHGGTGGAEMRFFPVLPAARLVLREFRSADAPAVFDIFARDEVTRYYNLRTMTHPDQAARLVRARMALFPQGTGIRWAICLCSDIRCVIGSCGCYNLNKDFHSIEIGYDLHPDYWRLGIMTEALSTMLDYVYGDDFAFPLNRVVALTELENQASAGLLLKLGFREEGVRREYGRWKGVFHDVRAFALLRRWWGEDDGRTTEDERGT